MRSLSLSPTHNTHKTCLKKEKLYIILELTLKGENMAKISLPAGFISIEDAVELIESDKRDNPVVDTAFMLRGLPYLRVNGNYNIKLLKRDENGRIVENGSKFVQIASEWERAQLEHAIVEHYKKTSRDHREIDPATIGLASLTTTIDEDKNPTGRLSVNDQPMTKYGDPTSGGEKTVEE